jgi:hypothetical protein
VVFCRVVWGLIAVFIVVEGESLLRVKAFCGFHLSFGDLNSWKLVMNLDLATAQVELDGRLEASYVADLQCF